MNILQQKSSKFIDVCFPLLTLSDWPWFHFCIFSLFLKKKTFGSTQKKGKKEHVNWLNDSYRETHFSYHFKHIRNTNIKGTLIFMRKKERKKRKMWALRSPPPPNLSNQQIWVSPIECDIVHYKWGF